MRKLILVLSFFLGGTCYAHNDWIPIQTLPTVSAIMPNDIIYTPNPRPILYYQWVPNVVMKPMIVEQKRIFIREQSIQMVPVTEWVPTVRVLYVWP